MSRTWFVTGSSTGFGRAITEAALKKGDNVIATLRKPSVLDDLVASTSSERLLVLKCDVSIEAEIPDAFAKGLAKFGAIDIVFNNAGYAIRAEAESTPNDAARKMFDVNFWGAANVSREAVRIFREVNGKDRGGWLFNVSSGGGIGGYPVIPYYCASKFALEGFTEGLSKELDPAWNIKITLIELGAYQTNGQGSSLVSFPAIPAYADEKLPSQILRRFFEDPNHIPGDIVKAARRVVEVSEMKDRKDAKIPLHWYLGKDSVSACVKRMRGVIQEFEEFESWSDTLLLILYIGLLERILYREASKSCVELYRSLKNLRAGRIPYYSVMYTFL